LTNEVVCGRIQSMKNSVIHGDCLEEMKRIEDGSVDMILCDLPYGTTACKWDSIIPFEPLWEHYKRVIKKNGAIVLTASQPFTTALISSNMDWFKYCWYWKKARTTGFQHSKNKPLKTIEDIPVFSGSPMGHKSLLGDKRMEYNPGVLYRGGKQTIELNKHGQTLGNRKNQVGNVYTSLHGFPKDLLTFQEPFGKNRQHPNEKPVKLFEYLIKTYTNEGETVLDNCAGSGTTGIACLNTNRNYILIEKEAEYIEVMKERIAKIEKEEDQSLERFFG
jgi:site-specific DNA-methyltransferase (adenine-specific)